jgi:dTMP kinase
MFIALEGPEGAGKSTLLVSLAEGLRKHGHHVVTTREPGATDLGQRIRDILLDGPDMHPRAELHLFLADRANHVENLILPALKQGKIVITDRHASSTVVYQGYARGGDVEAIRALNTSATAGLEPDLVLLLDVDPEVGLARQARSDRLGGQPLEFHEKVREGFLSEARRDPDRWAVLHADSGAEQVAERALGIVLMRLT